MRTLAVSLTLSGAVTIGGGWVAMRAIDSAIALSIRTKSVFSALTGTAVALLNVLIVAQLMFVSTSHDLRLLIALHRLQRDRHGGLQRLGGVGDGGAARSIASALRSLAAGQYRVRASIAGGDEVAALAADINALAMQAADSSRKNALPRRRAPRADGRDLARPADAAREHAGDGGGAG